MCGRYHFSLEQPTLRQLWERAQARFPNVKMEAGEIFPTNTVPVLLDEGGGVVPVPARWGLPHFKGSGVIINARAETAGEKRMFRESLRERRCAVPTSGFYEWSHDREKRKYRFAVRPGEPLYLAGLWQESQDGRRFVILTEAANASISDVHDRMPVILRGEQVDEWIADSAAAAGILAQPSPGLTREEEGNVQQSLY